MREVYENIYKPATAANQLSCWRVDEISRPGSITKDIVEGIFDADLIIADLSFRSANVFYELGIAHCSGNKTIMTVQDIKDVPFDIANYRVLEYSQTIAGSKKLMSDLDSAIKELLAALDRTNNPIQDAMAGRRLGGKRRKTPLVKYVDLASLPWQMRKWLKLRAITYAEDINGIDLEELFITKGLGRESLSKLLGPLVENDAIDDVEKLQRLLVEHGVNLRPRSYYSSY
ncbi:MAG: hypothetical protein DHS20C11_07190 [Lysobacteraceae bacterium]|nr:MAG: hypothetical protein DHS20C11_07190 [Xanthomonadaceae bacterium]